MAKRRTRLLAGLLPLVALSVLLTAAAGAEEWSFPGARYQGMGGAGVAVVDDAHASYWNPGALAFDTTQGMEIPFSFSTATLGDAIADADAIADFIDNTTLSGVIAKMQSGQPLTPTELQDALQLVVGKFPGLGESGEGFQTVPDLGLVVRHNRLAISLRAGGSLGIDPVFDLANLSFSDDVDALTQVLNVVGGGSDRSAQFGNAGSQALADSIAAAFGAWSQNQAEELVYQAEQTALDTSALGVRDLITRIAEDTAGLTAADLSANNSGAVVHGLLTQEVGVAYAHPLLGDRLGLGGNLKVINGISTSQFIRYDALQSGRDLVEELREVKNRETSQKVSLDLGILLRPDDRWRFGVVARNLNAPEFDTEGGDDFELEPQVRAGVAVNLLPNWVFAADVDLTENESENIDGFESRLLSVGTEYRIGKTEANVAVRAGAFTNLADADDAVTLTAGLGLRFWSLQLDLAVSAAPDFEELETGGYEIPSRLNVSGALKWVRRF